MPASGFEVPKTLSKRFKLLRDLVGLLIPVPRSTCAGPEAGAVAGVVEIEDFAEDDHQREEVAENAVGGALDVKAVAAERVIESIELAGLVYVVVQGLKEFFAFFVEEEHRAVVAQGQMAVLHVEKPPGPSPFFALFF